MGDLCVSCLSSDRKLTFIADDEILQLYMQILYEIKVFNASLALKICGQCHTMLRSFSEFKSQAQASYKVLQDNASTLPSQDLGQSSNLQVNNLDSQSDFLEPNYSLKEENLDIKDETIEINVEIPTYDQHLSPKPLENEKPLKLDDITNDGTDYSDADHEPIKKIKIKKRDKITKKKKRKKTIDSPKEVENKKFNVLILNDNDVVQERYKLYSSDEYLASEHRCVKCVLCFKNKVLLDNHNKECHDKKLGDHICQYCECRYPTLDKLKEHSLHHTHRYVCTVCEHVCKDVNSIEAHCKTHNSYTCDLCGVISSSSHDHQSHLNSAHDKKPTCIECGKVFASKKTYRYHLSCVHNGNNSHKCPHCGKVYQWKTNLWRHIRNHKAAEQGELYCTPCDRKFSSVATYRQHLKISSKHVTESDYSFTCEYCSSKFVSRSKLKDHIDWEHLNKIKHTCTECKKAFKTHTALYMHLSNVHNSRGQKDTLCHICGKVHRDASKLRAHVSAAHGARAHACSQCGAQFSWHSSLWRHLRSHQNQTKGDKRMKKPSPQSDTPIYVQPTTHQLTHPVDNGPTMT